MICGHRPCLQECMHFGGLDINTGTCTSTMQWLCRARGAARHLGVAQQRLMAGGNSLSWLHCLRRWDPLTCGHLLKIAF